MVKYSYSIIKISGTRCPSSITFSKSFKIGYLVVIFTSKASSELMTILVDPNRIIN